MLVVLLACGASLAGGAVLKGNCFGHGDDDWRARQCYNDIHALYHDEQLWRGRFPYTGQQFNEYPVLTGTFMWAVARVVSNISDDLVLSMVLLGFAAAVVAALLAWECGWRALAWAAAPPLALYVFHNWDVLAVVCTVAAFMLWNRGHRTWAGVALGIGAAFKLYPGLILVAFVAERLAARDVRGAVRVSVATVLSFALINLPYAVHDRAGWWATYRFQESRDPDPLASVWGYLPALSRTHFDLAFFGSLLVIAAAVLVFAQRRYRDSGAYPTAAVAGSAVSVMVALSPIGSPQYILWLLPFFALVRVGWAWWAVVSVVELALYAGLFGVGWWGLDLTTADHLVRAAVWGRTLVLLALPIGLLLAPNTMEGAWATLTFRSSRLASTTPASS